MKKFIKLLAVALAAAALAGCSLVSINTEKITVATVGEDTITKAAFDEGFNAFLAQYGYTRTAPRSPTSSRTSRSSTST